MNFDQIKYEKEGHLAIITLNRPEVLNAWTVTMTNEILKALDVADEDDDVRVVIFTGAGRAFCAGADLSSRGSGSDEDKPRDVSNDDVLSGARPTRDTAGRVTLRMFEMKKPIIGAVNGNAVGVGITMTLAMDIRIASENAEKIGFVFNRRGIVPEGCSTYFLPRIVGISLASELILSGRLFSAEEGRQMGLFSRVVPAEDLMTVAQGYGKGNRRQHFGHLHHPGPPDAVAGACGGPSHGRPCDRIQIHCPICSSLPKMPWKGSWRLWKKGRRNGN